MALLPTDSIGRLGRSAREIGPYAALALLLPGGTLIAALIWSLRHRSWLAAHARVIAARLLVAALGVLVSTCAGHSTPAQAPRPAVTVVPLRSGPVSLTTELPGRVSAYRVAAGQQQDEADVASAESAVRNAQINLGYTKMYSPISGRTGRSSVTEGALVTSNQATTLVTVTRLDPVYVDLTQPSTTILRFKRELASGQIRSVGADKAPAQLVLEDGGAYAASGTLRFSEVSVDEGTGTLYKALGGGWEQRTVSAHE
jgi:multidrug efflux pump subunit AcrA (membrane-fusion protein)